MNEIAPGVWQLWGFPPNAINVYVIEDGADTVLIDAATRWGRWRILRRLRLHPPTMVALTHAHPDHQGAAAGVCRKYRIPLVCHEADADVMEGRAPMPPHNPFARLARHLWVGPPHPVARRLRDGDVVAGFRVVHAPGHTPGHVAYFRDRDRVAITGDLFNNLSFLPGFGVSEPPHFFSVDPEQNRRSIRALAALRPSLTCGGHGPPLRRVELLQRYAQALSAHR